MTTRGSGWKIGRQLGGLAVFEIAFVIAYRFYLQSPAESLLSIQLFLFFVSIPFMFLSVLIAQQRRTDMALRESEERFRSLVDAGPVMVWMSGTDGLCTFFNRPWLDFTGRSMETEIGNGWVEGVHQEDREICVKQYLDAFEARRSFTMDYRLLRRDGVYRWILDQGIPRYGPDGSFLGYVGSCFDITDRKDAEDSLRQLNIHIVQVQEAERSRIAQELHDDLAQRTAMISMRLDQISRIYKDNARLQNEIYDVQQSATDLGTEITRVARQLHPRTVERLGLLYSLRVLCQQSSNDERTVSFVCDHETPSFGVESAVSLYRIAQESLRNALTHSGATEVVIEARTTTTLFQLSIKDNGCGFVLGSVASGLRLSGMAERMKNVGGTLSIHSDPGKGTIVTATIPIAKATKATN
jgi:PAS domain S-box-containing protein